MSARWFVTIPASRPMAVVALASSVSPAGARGGPVHALQRGESLWDVTRAEAGRGRGAGKARIARDVIRPARRLVRIRPPP